MFKKSIILFETLICGEVLISRHFFTHLPTNLSNPYFSFKINVIVLFRLIKHLDEIFEEIRFMESIEKGTNGTDNGTNGHN